MINLDVFVRRNTGDGDTGERQEAGYVESTTPSALQVFLMSGELRLSDESSDDWV